MEEEIEHDVEVHPPRVIDNVKGSYRLRQEADAPVIRAPA
jgi:hypothetical protein